MRLHEITLRNFRGVVDQTIHFADGVTIVEGPNEVGKSSIPEALHVLRTYKHTSTHRDVRALQPVGRDVGPEVSVRLSTGSHELTYRKQWLKEASAELHVSGEQPRQLTGDEAHQAYERILAETVDLDLLAALEVQQGESLAQANLAELRSLQNALDDEGTTDDGDDVLLQRIDEEYLRYFTPKGRRLGFRDQARTDVAELEAQVADLEGRSERMDQLTAQYERQVQAQHDAEQRLEHARKEFDAQRDRQAELHELERALDEATRAAEDARRRLERAREERAARRQAVEDLTRREDELRNQRAALDDARQRHDALRQASEAARGQRRGAGRAQRGAHDDPPVAAGGAHPARRRDASPPRAHARRRPRGRRRTPGRAGPAGRDHRR